LSGATNWKDDWWNALIITPSKNYQYFQPNFKIKQRKLNR